MPNPFHEGELAVQSRLGVQAVAATVGRMIEDTIDPDALPWLAQQRMFAVAAADPAGAVWCSLWLGERGFATSRDGTVLDFTLARDRTSPADPVRALCIPGARAGVLAIDLATRRRLRINGTVAAHDASTLALAITEAFPNCPRYIHRRALHLEAAAPAAAAPATEGTALTAAQRAWIPRVDTLFVGTQHPARGVDASHRGGPAGFVQVLDAATLRIPDYAGNHMFQTLGNLTVDPRAGAVLLDAATGRLLCVTGTATIHYGPERAWDLAITAWRELALPATVHLEAI